MAVDNRKRSQRIRKMRGRPLPSRGRERARRRQALHLDVNYGGGMPVPPEVRKRLFADWTRRNLDHVKLTRGWSVMRIAEEAKKLSPPGVSHNTIYRWRRGDWSTSPTADQIEAFCLAVGADTAIPFKILWPGRDEAPPAPEPLIGHPDAEKILRALADPSISAAEKTFLNELLRTAASRI